MILWRALLRGGLPMEYKAVYKCRLCGCTFSNGATTGEQIARADLFAKSVGITGTVPMAPRMM